MEQTLAFSSSAKYGEAVSKKNPRGREEATSAGQEVPGRTHVADFGAGADGADAMPASAP